MVSVSILEYGFWGRYLICSILKIHIRMNLMKRWKNIPHINQKQLKMILQITVCVKLSLVLAKAVVQYERTKINRQGSSKYKIREDNECSCIALWDVSKKSAAFCQRIFEFKFKTVSTDSFVFNGEMYRLLLYCRSRFG